MQLLDVTRHRSLPEEGKTTARDTWNNYTDATSAFKTLSNKPTQLDVENAMPALERFVVLLYDRTSTCAEVDEARGDLFTRKGRAIISIPPTSAALFQHVKRAAYQAGHCWASSLLLNQELPSPSLWEWTRSSAQVFEPFWTTLQEASKSCQELLKCGCKIEKGCRGSCKCVGADMKCTPLCKCGGDCDRS